MSNMLAAADIAAGVLIFFLMILAAVVGLVLLVFRTILGVFGAVLRGLRRALLGGAAGFRYTAGSGPVNGSASIGGSGRHILCSRSECGQSNPPQARYCGRCGTLLPGRSPDPSASGEVR